MLNRRISFAALTGRASTTAPVRCAPTLDAGDSDMGLMMVLEIESGVTMAEVQQTLADLGATVEGVSAIRGGLLPGSRCGFGLTLHRFPLRLLADGLTVKWTVGLTMTFHFRAANKVSSLAEIYPFIELFAQQHRYRFVLSFQYERIYAVRSERGLKLLWPFPKS